MQSTNKALYSHNAEKNLVIAFLSLDDAILEGQADISPAEFFYTPYRNIATICYDLFNNGKQVDIVSIENELRKKNQLEDLSVEDDIWLLKNEVAQGTIENNGKIVRDYYKRRTLLQILQTNIPKIYNEGLDINEIIESIQTSSLDLDKEKENETKSFGELRKKTLDRARDIKNARESGNKSHLIRPKLNALANIIDGYGKGELITVAGRPGMGKSIYLIDESVGVANAGYNVGIFSFEMSDTEVTGRVLANTSSSVQYRAIGAGRLSNQEEKELILAGTNIENNIFINDSPAMSIEKLRSSAIKMKIKNKIDILFIDYLQLMNSSEIRRMKGNREQEISHITASLKRLAKELDIPIIQLAQLSRAVETRGGAKRPMLSDLRESGGIEQDSNKVIFLYRPEYYDIQEYEGGVSALGVTELIVAKNREGASSETAKVDSRGLPSSRFDNITDGRFESSNNVF